MRQAELKLAGAADRDAAAADDSRKRRPLENAKLNLSKVRIESPITGIITRRNIEEGETVVIGTMNNAGTVLLTIADMSVIEAEVEVDETDIPNVKLGQKAKVTIDAMPGKTFPGKVTEIGNSPIQAAGAQPRRRRRTSRSKVTLDGEIPEVRPGFTCTAEITTATRDERRRGADPGDDGARDDRRREGQHRPPSGEAERAGRGARRPSPASELKPGQKRKELEGVFVVQGQQGDVRAGEDRHRRREVLRGPVGRQGRRQVIIGPFSPVRELADGAAVKVEAAGAGRTTVN